MAHYQRLDKKKSREATIGLVVIGGLCLFFGYLVFLRLHNKYNTPGEMALSGRTIYYKDSPEGLIATGLPKKTDLVDLPDLESNEIVDLGGMKAASPERFFQIAGTPSGPSTSLAKLPRPDSLKPIPVPAPSSDTGTRLAANGILPPGSKRNPLSKNPSKPKLNDSSNLTNPLSGRPNFKNSLPTKSTITDSNGFRTKKPSDLPADSDLQEGERISIPGRTDPTSPSVKHQQTVNPKPSTPVPEFFKPEEKNPLPAKVDKTDQETKPNSKLGGLFSAIPQPMSDLNSKGLSSSAKLAPLTSNVKNDKDTKREDPVAKTTLAGKPVIRPVNHYAELIRKPNVSAGPLPLLTSIYHESWKTSKTDRLGRHYIAMGRTETVKQFAFRVTGAPGFQKAIAKLNHDRSGSDGRFPAGSMLRVMPADHLIRKFPSLCPSQKLYMTRSGDTFFSIAYNQLGQAGRFTEVMELNRHLLSIFAVKSFSGTEEIPSRTPIWIPARKK